MNSKNIVVGALVVVLIGAITYLFLNSGEKTVVDNNNSDAVINDTMPTQPDTVDSPEPVEEMVVEEARTSTTVIGASVNGESITAYHFGTGDSEVLLIGGTHGSYSPNTSKVANEAVTYFTENPSAVPAGVMVTIIPNLNPDGLVTGGTNGRFNTNEVDLNRNFDCEWSATAVWRDQKVSGGSAAFSEPEAVALRDYVEKYDPKAAIVWFSAEGKVYPSACGSTPSKASVELAATFATAAKYPAAAEFNAYAITGDMVNWMAKQGIPSISVLLSDHQSSEWSKNKAGIEAVLKAYSN